MVDGNSGNKRFTFYGKAFVKIIGDNLVVNFDGTVGSIHWDLYPEVQPVNNPQSNAKKASGGPLVMPYNGEKLLYVNASDGKYYAPIYNADGETVIPVYLR